MRTNVKKSLLIIVLLLSMPIQHVLSVGPVKRIYIYVDDVKYTGCWVLEDSCNVCYLDIHRDSDGKGAWSLYGWSGRINESSFKEMKEYLIKHGVEIKDYDLNNNPLWIDVWAYNVYKQIIMQ